MRSLIRTEITESLRLTIPLACATWAQAATGFVDTVMMGLGQLIGVATSTGVFIWRLRMLMSQ